MRILIRYIHTRGLGQEIHEHVFDGDVITIGRGADQAIQIPDQRVALAHSKITRTASKLAIIALQDHRCSVNGNVTNTAPLVIGDLIDISGYSLRIHAAEGDVDYIIEVGLDHDTVAPLRDRFYTRLRQIGVPGRQFAWFLFIVILGFSLLIPVSGFFTNMQALRDSPFPDDRIWSSGDLHATHAFMADDCNFCHVDGFTQTRDAQCLECHRTINHHFDTSLLGLDYKVVDACGDCHQEHSATGTITRSDEEVCSVCHADLEDAGFSSERLGNASDFAVNHPDFKASLLRQTPTGTWETERLALSEPGLQESSNLLFPHDVHLAAAGVEAPDGIEVMVCADCHVSEKGGLRMQVVTMESHCSRCHQLGFDAESPDRVVPHGSPELVMQNLREFYALQFLERFSNSPAAQSGGQRQVRRPGQPAHQASLAERMLARPADGNAPLGTQAQAFIDRQVAETAANLFEKQTCVLCHEITVSDNQQVPWQVLPVRLSKDWLPLAEFSHDSHKNMDCGGCHEAGASALASDVLLPDIKNCRSCHGGEAASELLPSSCVSCHGFHLQTQPHWLAGQEPPP